MCISIYLSWFVCLSICVCVCMNSFYLCVSLRIFANLLILIYDKIPVTDLSERIFYEKLRRASNGFVFMTDKFSDQFQYSKKKKKVLNNVKENDLFGKF